MYFTFFSLQISGVIDEDSEFFEIGATAGMELEYGDVPCAGLVTGIAKVRGIHCVITGADGTVKGKCLNREKQLKGVMKYHFRWYFIPNHGYKVVTDARDDSEA